MRIRIAMVLVCGLALSAVAAADEKSDQDKLQGKWKMESGTHGGKPLPDEIVKGSTITIDGKTMKMTRTAEGKDQTREMTFKLDPSKKPKTIDVDMDGKPGLGIYSLDGDTLKICHGDQGDERPTTFESKEGSNVTVVVLKRVK
jgi:uncharacterized protein (TIGR03067 family)